MKFLKKTLPHLNFLTKAILVLVILSMAVIGGLSIRLGQGPIDLEFIKPKIESALNQQIEGYNVEIGKLALSWDGITEPILFDLNQVIVAQNGGSDQESKFEKIAIGLSAEHLLIGRILPSIVEIEDPIFQLIEKNGELSFFWQGGQAKKDNVSSPVDPIDEKQVRRDVKDFLNEIFLQDEKKSNILSALKKIELKRAVIRSFDKKESEQSYLALVDLSLIKDSLGLNGNLNISLPSGEGRDAYLKSDIIYRKEAGDITFTAKVNDINPSYLIDIFPSARLLSEQNLFIDGEVKVAFDSRLKLQNATLNLNIPEGNIVVPDIYDDGLALQDIKVNADLDAVSKSLNVSELTANIGGIAFSGKTNISLKNETITAPIELKVADFETNDLAKIFPKAYVNSSAGQWLTKKLSEGLIKDALFTANLEASPRKVQGDNPKNIEVGYEVEFKDVKATFAGDGITVKYSDTLMPVTNAVATGVYENDTLSIKGEKANIGDMAGRNVDLKLTNLSKAGGGMAYLTLNANGPFKTALKYASDEPIAMGESFGFKLDDVKGDINFDLNLEFPTVKDLLAEQVIVKIDGTITHLMLPNIVRGLPLTGGPYKMKFADGKISLSGKGKLAGRDIDVSWEEFVSPQGRDYESQIKAKIIADEGLREAFNIGLEEYVSGPIPVDVTYTDRGVPATIDITGDLKPTVLHIDPFGYKKPVGAEGSLSLKAFMKNDDIQEIDQLSMKADNFALNNGRIIFKKLKDGSDDISRGSIAQAIIGKSNLKVDFEITPDNVMKVIASGPVFDLVPFTKTKNNSATELVVSNESDWENPEKSKAANDNQPLKISLQAQKILAEKNMTLNAAKVYLETDKQRDIVRAELDANVGSGALYVRFKPDEVTGKRNFRLESSDAGSTLKAFGLYDRINGGKLVIYGEPKQGDNSGNIFGKAQIDNFSVSKAPVLAKLLGTMSQTGVQDILQNNGLSFSKLESDFEWQFRPQGNLLVMQKGRTSGSSLGLTFEGIYNQERSTIDISGTVIPLSGVNKAIGEIPLIGKILTGGKAFLAATYKISGPSSDPKVSINPLSVLAPGFIRNILFEESVERKVEKAQ